MLTAYGVVVMLGNEGLLEKGNGPWVLCFSVGARRRGGEPSTFRVTQGSNPLARVLLVFYSAAATHALATVRSEPQAAEAYAVGLSGLDCCLFSRWPPIGSRLGLWVVGVTEVPLSPW